jgi:hypothetical protein
MDAIARLLSLDGALLQPVNNSKKIGKIVRIEIIFIRIDGFNLRSSIIWGCSGIIRACIARHERHLTGTPIGIIAYPELRLCVLV